MVGGRGTSVGALEPGAGAGVAELRAAGRRGPADSEPASRCARAAPDSQPTACWSRRSTLFGRLRLRSAQELFRTNCRARLEAMPGVQSAAFVAHRRRSAIAATRRRRSRSTATSRRPTSADRRLQRSRPRLFFATIGIPLVAGREFTRADDEKRRPVAVVNETMAAQYWRGADPVGRALQVKGRWMRVVGVAEAKYGNLLETPKPSSTCRCASTRSDNGAA